MMQEAARLIKDTDNIKASVTIRINSLKALL